MKNELHAEYAVSNFLANHWRFRVLTWRDLNPAGTLMHQLRVPGHHTPIGIHLVCPVLRDCNVICAKAIALPNAKSERRIVRYADLDGVYLNQDAITLVGVDSTETTFTTADNEDGEVLSRFLSNLCESARRMRMSSDERT